MKKLLMIFFILASTASWAKDTIVLTEKNTVRLSGEINYSVVSNVIRKFKFLDSDTKSKDPIYLVIDTPGGSVMAGKNLISSLSSLNHRVDTITSFAASMGFQTVQGLGKRYILQDGILMSHRAEMGSEGQVPGNFDTRSMFFMREVQKLDEIAAARTKGKLSVKQYQSLIRDEFWCSGKDCTNYNFVDSVVTARCDSSLLGEEVSSVYQDMVQGHTLEIFAIYDRCPTNTRPLSFKILIDGALLFPVAESDKLAAVVAPSAASSYNISADIMSFIKSKVDNVVNSYSNKTPILKY